MFVHVAPEKNEKKVKNLMLEINRLYSITGTPHTHGLTTPSTLKYPKMGG